MHFINCTKIIFLMICYFDNFCFKLLQWLFVENMRILMRWNEEWFVVTLRKWLWLCVEWVRILFEKLVVSVYLFSFFLNPLLIYKVNPMMIFQTGLSSNLHYKSSIAPLTYYNLNQITKQFNKTWDKGAHANQLPRQNNPKKHMTKNR
jgi:hypothetical protein